MGASILSTLGALRTAMVDALTEAGIKAYEYVPDNVNPPVALVVPADPYVTAGDEATAFAYPYRVNVTVVLLASKGTNKAAQNKIDSMVESALEALEDWDINEVSAPLEMNVKGVQFAGIAISLFQNTNLKEVT